MNKVKIFLSLGLASAGIFLVSSIKDLAISEPWNGTFQIAVQGYESAPALISTNSEVITGVLVGSGATAQSLAILDATAFNTASGNQNTKVVAEVGAAANTSTYVDFSDKPIRVKNGVVGYPSRTDGYYVIYLERNP